MQAVGRRGWNGRRQIVAWVPQRPAVGRFPLLVKELLASSGDSAARWPPPNGSASTTWSTVRCTPCRAANCSVSYLARGLGHVAAGARLMLADEPTSALDFDTRDAVAALLTEVPVDLHRRHSRRGRRRRRRSGDRDGRRSHPGGASMSALLATTDVWALFELPVVQRSALALLIASIGLPIVGVLMIGLDVIPVRFAVMHTALLGVALGLVFGIDPVLCAMVVSASGRHGARPARRPPGRAVRADGSADDPGHRCRAAGAEHLGSERHRRVRAAVGLDPRHPPHRRDPAVHRHRRRADAVLRCAVAGSACCCSTARPPSAPASPWARSPPCASGITAVAIASSIRLTGALLVDAVTLLPAVAARNLARSFTSMAAWAVASAWWATGSGSSSPCGWTNRPGRCW